MLRSALPLAALAALGACAYPYTPPALSPVTQPAPPATGARYTTAATPPAATGTRYAGAATAPAMQEARAPVTILVSIDGFRPDYLARGVTPNLSRLAATGVSANMRPSFPSKTFPNHWTLVTGLRPDRHGIVANSFITLPYAGTQRVRAAVHRRTGALRRGSVSGPGTKPARRHGCRHA